MAKHTRKKKLQNKKLGLAGDVEMKAVSQKKKAPPTQIVGGCLSELIDQAAAEHRAVVAKEREKKLPRGQRSKAQKSRKIDRLEKAMTNVDRSVSKVEKRNSKKRQKAVLKGIS